VRDPVALAKLPEDEQQACRAAATYVCSLSKPMTSNSVS